VLGTTRVGKTRLAELFITQDIRRKVRGQHEVVIVFDPKGDADLLKRMYVEAKRAGREGEFYVFHLGWPDISARYNAVGRFGRISEVATRIAGQLSGEGNSAAFREFAWRFVNIIARALVELGQRPDYLLIQRHVINIDALFIEYAQHYFAKNEPKAWEVIVQLEAKLNDKNIPRNMIGREARRRAGAVPVAGAHLRPGARRPAQRGALRQDVLRQDRRIAPAAAGEADHRQDRAVAGAELFGPRRPAPDLRLDADHQEARRGLCRPGCAVGRGSRGGGRQLDVQRPRIGRGHIYKFGIDDGLPGAATGVKVPINVHADEFNELMGDEFIPWSTRAAARACRSRPTRRPSRTSRPASATARRPARWSATSTTCSCCACARPPRPNC
jgi:hypothetical protein